MTMANSFPWAQMMVHGGESQQGSGASAVLSDTWSV
jgi:hypothetical protein